MIPYIMQPSERKRGELEELRITNYELSVGCPSRRGHFVVTRRNEKGKKKKEKGIEKKPLEGQAKSRRDF
jgi:hypothetical protein